MNRDARAAAGDVTDLRAPLAQRFAAAGVDWIVPQWSASTRVHAFATTRNGGTSTGACASLDLGSASLASVKPDAAAAIVANRRRTQAFLPAPPVWLEQVHGAAVVSIGAVPPASPPRADAAVTRATRVVLAVRIADCMPLLFAARDGSVIAVAHAGWRGLAAGILENTVDAMDSDPAGIVAWLGPAIGPAAFEVGADVRDAFVRGDAAARHAFVDASPGKWLADLEALTRMRLARAGVRSIDGGGMCTMSDPSRFFSFRRDGPTGRMAAFVWRGDRCE
ncbi:MAG TPA: peptidoglycan editing factor PgeF [Casimicrobiaceae bacterium]|nr:peptidoglycan editing factor PgeF [Casimicrobiaceae bacterium]